MKEHPLRPSPQRPSRLQGELQRAHIALLEHESIMVTDREVFRLVSNHYRALQYWHDQYTGWRIIRHSTVVRLVRPQSVLANEYLFETMRESRDFACLVWILWYSEHRNVHARGDSRQFLLSDLSERIQEQSASDRGQLDFRKYPDRLSIQRALRYLEHGNYLRAVDGQTQNWVNQEAEADVLYEFTDVIRTLVAAFDPDRVAQSMLLMEHGGLSCAPALLPGSNAVLPLHRVWRALLIGPVFLRYDDPNAFAFLLANADAMIDAIADIFGWQCLVTREYACIIRGSGTSQGPNSTLSVTGTFDHIILLLCGELRTMVSAHSHLAPDAFGCLHMQREDLAALFYDLRTRYDSNWGKTARETKAESLLSEVFSRMRRLGLLRGPDVDGKILITPLAARYNAVYEGEPIDDSL